VCPLIKINVQLFKQLIEYCTLQLPKEACGVFFGSQEQDSIVIQSYKPITNIASSAGNQFEFDRGQLLKLLYTKQESLWVGIFHSHPLTAAYPSDKDLENLWNFPVFAIISFAQSKQPILKSFEIIPNQKKKPYSIKEQTIQIILDSN
jgi:proteasome lid subunit RPN8/RPN11